MKTPVPTSRPCECGCGAIITRQYGRLRRFVNRAHVGQAPHLAEFRRRRSVAAVKVAVASRRKAAERRAERFPSKSKAWSGGYRVGYNRACRWWSAKYARVYAELLAVRKGRAA